MIVYDIEIKHGIRPKKKADTLPGIQYCESWTDYTNMGISVICAYDYPLGRELAFSDDIPGLDGNLKDFQARVDANDFVVGFNNVGFDDVVCRASGLVIPQEKSFDILRGIWFAVGLSNKFNRLTHSGLGLDAVTKANGLGTGKSGSGEHAPVWFQRGEYDALVKYCKQDVALTKLLLDKIVEGQIVYPRTGKLIKVGSPYED